MKIHTDYSNYNTNRYKTSYATYNKDIAFEGLNIRRLFSSSKQNISVKSLNEYASQLAGFLGMDTNKVAPRVENMNDKERRFLQRLAVRFSDENFYLSGNVKEKPELVFTAFSSVPKPKEYHYKILSRTKGSFEYISRLLPLADSEKSFEFIEKFQKKILRENHSNKNMLIEMLQSPFKKKYVEHFDDFKSYLLLNKNNPEAIKELDLLMEHNNYDREAFDIRIAIKQIFGSNFENFGKILNPDNIEKYYTKSGAMFLDKFVDNYYMIRKNKLDSESELTVLDMFKSTTKDNVDSRLGVLKKFYSRVENSQEDTKAEISAMKDLFDLMDSDKHARKFVDKFTSNGHVTIDSIQSLYDVLVALTPKKIDIFSDNVFRIFRRVGGDSLIPTLEKHYNDPFFETKASRFHKEQMERYGYKVPESRWSKFKRKITNKLNEFKYAHSSKETVKPSEKEQKPIQIQRTQQVPEQPVMEQHTIKIEGNPVVTETSKEKSKAIPFEWNTQKALPLQPERQPQKPVKIELPPIDDILRTEKSGEIPVKLEHILTDNKEKPVIKLVNTVKESPKARKLRLIGEVNDIISKRLGAKTVETQSEVYSKNVTKMRLKMLPEIFESIKETRQTDRAVGKLKSISSNKDAVDLYRLINGSNRKYVKYLLEKRNIDGTRMFEVKDIISMVEKANKRVEAMKKANPEFRAKDAKAYFDHLYEAKIEQYGKVKKAKKK